uniref:ERAD-associated E3 ubiquitin-protein ligase component HRD3A n=1 Tax=Kalanchoe fedtschenkoi TaxID=63787 RepID=A0A7N0TKJ5_KALFE
MRRLAFILCLILFPVPISARRYVLVLSQDDLNSPSTEDDVSDDWDDFGAGMKPDNELDPGSWTPILDPGRITPELFDSEYYSPVSKMISAASRGDPRALGVASSEIEAAALDGNPHAQSVLGYLYQMGIMRERNGARAFLYHHFAAEGGNMQSKMVTAYTYYKQDMYDDAIKLYAELAAVSVNSFLISKDSPVTEPVRINNGAEENKQALRKSRGEDDEDFQILEYQALKGNADAMYRVGVFHCFGLRGLQRDHQKALSWFSKAAEKGDSRAMELLGEFYARGVGVERNYTKSYEWLTQASKLHLYSSYNGLGYLYVKGYGVERNYTKAKEYFEMAAENDDAGGHYNLGVMYFKGFGMKRDVRIACKCFMMAANLGQPKAFYQLAKMFHSGTAVKKNLPMATALYKLVAERGPWSSMSRWALEAYLKGDIGKAFFLYLRMAEQGYEVAQSNAAWILDKYGGKKICIGASGLCTDAERHQHVHSLWWQASELGNEHAALLIGDAYYYGQCKRLWVCSECIYACEVPIKCTSYVQSRIHA